MYLHFCCLAHNVNNIRIWLNNNLQEQVKREIQALSCPIYVNVVCASFGMLFSKGVRSSVGHDYGHAYWDTAYSTYLVRAGWPRQAGSPW